MAAMKSALLVTLLLLLGSEHSASTSIQCSTGITACIGTYTFNKAANLLTNSNSCDPYNTLKSCNAQLVTGSTCTQQEVNEYSGLTTIRSSNAHCSGTTARASIIMLVITAALGLVFKA